MDLQLNINDLSLDWSDFKEEGMRIEIFGQSGAGKSYGVKVLIEEFLRYDIPFVVIDPEGEYASFREITSAIIIGGRFADVPLDVSIVTEAVRLLFTQNFSLIFDISDIVGIEKRSELAAMIQKTVFEKATEHRRLILYVVDEAKLIAPQSRKTESNIIAADIAQRGRKRGIIPIFSMQRPSEVDKSVITQCNVHVMGKLQFPTDLNYVKDLLRDAGVTQSDVKNLSQEFFLWSGGNAEKIRFRALQVKDLGRTVQPGEQLELEFIKDSTITEAIAKLKNLIEEKDKRRQKKESKLITLNNQLKEKEKLIGQLQEELKLEREAKRIAKMIDLKVEGNIPTRDHETLEELQQEIKKLRDRIKRTEKASEITRIIERNIGRSSLAIQELKLDNNILPVEVWGIDKSDGNVVGEEKANLLLNEMSLIDRLLYFSMISKGKMTESKVYSLIKGKGKMTLRPALRRLMKHGLVERTRKSRRCYYEAKDFFNFTE